MLSCQLIIRYICLYFFIFQNSLNGKFHQSMEKSDIHGNSEQSSGDTNVSALRKYLKAAKSNFLVFILIVLFAGTTIFTAVAEYWLAYW